VQVDITPREYVLDYLQHSFPVQLYEPYTDSEGNLLSRPVMRDGQPVESREAVARRDELIEKLASLPPVPGALDQIVQRFGTDMVAEVTGRSRRIVRKGDKLLVENRAGSANLAETAAFMDDEKRILVFSDAGGTGPSYHAELSARNRRLRIHYLLEPGWKVDAAIQGLGRTNRTNQAQPPLFRPIATDVKPRSAFSARLRAASIRSGGEFERTGFRGGLNWYRNIDRNWELLAPFAGAKVTVPALYMAGDRDLVVAFHGMDQVIANLANDVPQLRGKIMLPGCGHWTQQERASEVNAAMIDFLHQL